MSAAESIKKALAGDKSTEIIKSGTLVTTRGTGVIAVGLIGTFFLLDALNVAPWQGLSSDAKLVFVLATGAMWALIVAADSIARGIATAASVPTVVKLPPGLLATKTSGLDSPNWSVLAVEIAPDKQETKRFLVAKGSETSWVGSEDLVFQNG